ncbi:hypothetical protein CR513_24123, partial [Mucuna pruriens]
MAIRLSSKANLSSKPAQQPRHSGEKLVAQVTQGFIHFVFCLPLIFSIFTVVHDVFIGVSLDRGKADLILSALATRGEPPPSSMAIIVEERSTNDLVEHMENNNDRTLKELATPNVVYQPWCIQRRSPQALEGIPCGLLHNETTSDTERLHQDKGVFILPGWSSKRLVVSIVVLCNTWGVMKHMFLEKLFLASKTATIREEICEIRQHSGETLHEYWERFNKLCTTCLHHQISEQLLIQYFYEALTMMDRSMIDDASRVALMDKVPAAARHLISNMASNTKQFGIRKASQSQMVYEIDAVDNLRLENQLAELTSLVRQLAIGQHQPSIEARVYGICTSMEHPTDMCPILLETESDYPTRVGAIGGY